MRSLAVSTIRTHRASFAGTFVVMTLATALLSAVGVLMESGLRGGIAPYRYDSVDVVLTVDGTTVADATTAADADAADADATTAAELVTRLTTVEGVDDAATDVSFALTTMSGEVLAAHNSGSMTTLGTPLTSGRAPARTGEVVVDSATGHHVGDEVTLRYGGLPGNYTVVGTVDGSASAEEGAATTEGPVTAERPRTAYLLDQDVLTLWPNAARSAAVVVSAEAGVDADDLAERIADAVPGADPLTGRAKGAAEFPHAEDAGATLTALTGSTAGTTIVIVFIVLSSTMSLVAQQRRRGFALMRAIGATPSQLRSMLTQEVAVVAAIATPLGALLGAWGAFLVKPLLVSSGVIPADFELVLSPLPVIAAVAAVTIVGLLGALSGARKHLRIAPTDALRQAAVESPTLGRVRRFSAVICGGIGVLAALSPWFVPGALGGASAGASALLLVIAAALAGPLLVEGTFAHLASRLRGSGGASVQLALANSRGFSRRLTAVIVPLALVVAFGTVQNLVGGTLGAAATDQLSEGLRSDVIVNSEAGLHPRVVDQLRHLPGVSSLAPTSTDTVELKTDSEDEEVAFLEGLSWELVPVRTVPESDSTELLDLDVSEGSLTALAKQDTIAISRDAQTEYMLSLGDTAPLRQPGSDTSTPVTVVAVYERGLGFGNLVMGEANHATVASDILADTVLLDVEPGQAAMVAAGVADLGLTLTDRDAYISEAGQAEAQSQSLSLTILLILLAFIGLGALNSLVMTTAGRRDEFDLLGIIGSSRTQVLRTGVVEAVIVGVAGIAVGVAAVLPAILGVTYGFGQTAVPVLNWTLVGGLVLVVAVVPLVGIPAVATAMTRRAASGHTS